MVGETKLFLSHRVTSCALSESRDNQTSTQQVNTVSLMAVLTCHALDWLQSPTEHAGIVGRTGIQCKLSSWGSSFRCHAI